MATFLAGPAGPLEMLYRGPEGDRAAGAPVAAVVCHPHPAFGGTMHNKVVYHLARGLMGAGLHVLRFNYRGVGLSAGRYDEGVGESADVRAALDWLAERHVGPLLLAGFSFGARFGLPVGLAHPRVGRIVGVGLAVRMLAAEGLVGDKPALFVHGEKDEYGAAGDVVALAERWTAPTEVLIFQGCGHFFDKRLGLLAERVGEWVSRAPRSGVETV